MLMSEVNMTIEYQTIDNAVKYDIEGQNWEVIRILLVCMMLSAEASK